MVNHRLTAILAIDVAGYSARMTRDPEGLLAALNDILRSVIRPSVASSRGRIVKLMGDGALIEFSSARSALLCAARIQKTMGADPPPYNFPEPIELRMGVHAGDVLVKNNDLFGDALNIAARLEAAAEPGAILASRTVVELAGSGLPITFREEGARRFKNITRPIETLSVSGQETETISKSERLGNNEQLHFARTSDSVTLAWTSTGSGPPLVKAQAWISRLDLDWRNPGFGHLIQHFSQTHRLVRFDARGNGLSDREIGELSFDRMVSDLGAIFDAAAIERAPVICFSQGCAIAAAFAARQPDRVSALVMVGAFPQGRLKRNSEKDSDRAAALQAMLKAGWDDEYPSLRDLLAETINPLASLEDRRQFAADMREAITPAMIAEYRAVLDEIDITSLLDKVPAPCLVMHCKGDRVQPIEQGRLMAALLPNARFLTYDSPNHVPTENDPCWPAMRREIDRFLVEHST